MSKGRNTVIVPEQNLGLDPAIALDNVFGKGSVSQAPVGTYASSKASSESFSTTNLSDLNEEQKQSIYFTEDENQNKAVINETLGQDQSSIGAWAKGLTKFVGKTATATVGGTLGVLYGLGSSISNLEFNKLYDNDFTKSLDKADKWMDDNMKIYQTKEAEDRAWYQQMIPFTKGSAKFWADDVLGGLSFTVGAVLSEGAWGLATASTLGAAEPLLAANTARITAKAANLLKNITKSENLAEKGLFARQIVTGSGYEAGVEARHTKNEIITNMKKEYFDAKGQEVDEKSPEYAEMLDKANQAANAVFGANMAILSAGNAVALPKTFGALNKGLSSAIDKTGLKLFNPITTVERVSEKGLERAALATGKTVEELKSSQFLNKWDTYNKLTKAAIRTGAAVKTPLTEGLWEEGTQGVASAAAKNYVARKYDPSGIDQTVSMWDSIGEALQETYGSEAGWKDIGIGMIIGAMGLPHVGRKTNPDGTTSRNFSWQGGSVGAITGSDIRRENAETADLVDLMNNNKALVSTKGIIQASVRTGSNANEQEPKDLYDAKNKESEDFFNFVHSRHKGGYFANIKDELASGIKNMKPDEFADMFGYSNMTEDELKQRQKEVVTKTVERADKIKKAIEIAEKINKTGDDNITEGLAYSISMLDNIDERQDSMIKNINQELGLSLTKENVSKLNGLTAKIKNKSRDLKAAEKYLQESVDSEDPHFIEESKKAHKKIVSELNKLQKEVTTLQDKKEINDLLSTYSGDLTQVTNLLDTNKTILEKVKTLSPEKIDNIKEAFYDLRNLDERRQTFIESYNNLRTKEGQEQFKSDIENFKSYLFADIPEGLAKRSATLAYYKKQGEQLRRELEKSNEPPSNLNSSGVVFTPPVVPQPTATPVQQPASPFQYFPPDPVEDTPQEKTEQDLINEAADILNNLGNNMDAGAEVELSDDQAIITADKLRVVARSLKTVIKRDNPLLTPKEIIERVVINVNKVTPLTKQKYNLLLNALNTEVALGKEAEVMRKTYDEFFAEKEPEQSGVDIVGNQNNKSDKVISVEGVEYGHDKNVNPAFSLAYLSHEYTKQDGKLVSTGKLSENENNQALLTSNEAFTQAGNIVANAQIDLLTPINEKLLDFKVEITLQDKGQTVKTSLHDPKWIINITDKNDNSLIADPQLEILIDLAKKKDNKAIVTFLSRSEFTGGNVNKFRNTGGESVSEVVDHFVKLVQLRQQFLNIQDKSVQIPVTITSISPGKISFNKEFKSSKETLPDKNLKFAIVGQNGELMATSNLNHSQNENVLGNTDYLLSLSGSVVVLIPTRKGDKVIPIGVRTNKISNNSQEQDLFYGGLIEFLSANSKKVKIGNNTLDLGKTKDVKKFMAIYSTYMPNISTLDASRHVGQVLIDFSDATDTRGKAIKLVIPDVIVSDSNTAESLFIRNIEDLEKTLFNLAAENKLKVNSITITKEGVSIPINENTKVKDLLWSYPIGKKTSVEAAIGDDSLLEKPVQISQFVRNTQTSKLDELPEKIVYTEHIKNRTSSNVNGTIQDPLNKDKNVYFEQPIYEFGVDTTQVNKVAENQNKAPLQEELIPQEQISDKNLLTNINLGLTDRQFILLASINEKIATVGNYAKSGIKSSNIELTNEELSEVNKMFKAYNKNLISTEDFNNWRVEFSDKVLSRVKNEMSKSNTSLQEKIIAVEDVTMTADTLFDDLISVDNTFEQSRQNDVNKKNGTC